MPSCMGQSTSSPNQQQPNFSKSPSDKLLSTPDCIIQNLYLYLKQYGDHIVQPTGTLLLTANSLRILCQYLDALPRMRLHRFDIQTSSSSHPRSNEDTLAALEFIDGMLQAVHSLKITNPPNTPLSHYVDLGRFSPSEPVRGHLVHLELCHVPIQLVKNLRSLREVLLRLSLHHCVSSVRSVVGLCGADLTYPAAWPALQHLDLRDNNLTSLDDSLHHLTNIRILDLSRNSLTECRGLEHLVSLESLNLSYNFLSTLPKLNPHVNESLKVLLVAYNALESTEGIGELSHLQVLDISFNCILSVRDLRGLADLLRLHKLRVMGNPFTLLKGHRRRTLAMLSACVPHKFLLDDVLLSQAEIAFLTNSVVQLMSASHSTDVHSGYHHPPFDLHSSVSLPLAQPPNRQSQEGRGVWWRLWHWKYRLGAAGSMPVPPPTTVSLIADEVAEDEDLLVVTAVQPEGHEGDWSAGPRASSDHRPYCEPEALPHDRPFASLDPNAMSHSKKRTRQFRGIILPRGLESVETEEEIRDTGASTADIEQLALGSSVEHATLQQPTLTPAYSTGKINHRGSALLLPKEPEVVNQVDLDDVGESIAIGSSRTSKSNLLKTRRDPDDIEGDSELVGTPLDDRVRGMRKAIDQLKSQHEISWLIPLNEERDPLLLPPPPPPVEVALQSPPSANGDPNVHGNGATTNGDVSSTTEMNGTATSSDPVWLEDLHLSKIVAPEFLRMLCIRCEHPFTLLRAEAPAVIRCPLCQTDMTRPVVPDTEVDPKESEICPETPEKAPVTTTPSQLQAPALSPFRQGLLSPKVTFFTPGSLEGSPTTPNIMSEPEEDSHRSRAPPEPSTKTRTPAYYYDGDSHSEHETGDDDVHDQGFVGQMDSDLEGHQSENIASRYTPVRSPQFTPNGGFYDDDFFRQTINDTEDRNSSELQHSSANPGFHEPPTIILTQASQQSLAQSSVGTEEETIDDSETAIYQLRNSRDGHIWLDLWNFSCRDPSLEVQLRSVVASSGESGYAVVRCWSVNHGKGGLLPILLVATKTGLTIIDWKESQDCSENRERLRTLESWPWSNVLSIRPGLGHQWLTVRLVKPRNRVMSLVLSDETLTVRCLAKLSEMFAVPSFWMSTEEAAEFLHAWATRLLENFVRPQIEESEWLARREDRSLLVEHASFVRSAHHSSGQSQPNRLLIITATHLLFCQFEFVPLTNKSTSSSSNVLTHEGVRLELSPALAFSRVKSLSLRNETGLVLHLFSSGQNSDDLEVDFSGFAGKINRSRAVMSIRRFWRDLFKVDLMLFDTNNVSMELVH